MARRCFEVEKLMVQFHIPKKDVDSEAILEEIKKYFSKYASNTEIVKESRYEEFGMKEIEIQLNKTVSVNTVNNVFSQMFVDTTYWYQTIYNGSSNKMTVKVLK